jgi:hypothetical protein
MQMNWNVQFTRHKMKLEYHPTKKERDEIIYHSAQRSLGLHRKKTHTAAMQQGTTTQVNTQQATRHTHIRQLSE